jgi:carbamoyl-phosphate synthase large subunit
MDKLDLHQKRVLVTGGAGVIGRELLELLNQRGAQTLSVDRLPLDTTALENVRHVQLDLAVDPLDELLTFRPSVVLHLAAAFERSAETAEFWEPNWSDNVLESHRVVDLMRGMAGVEVFVFASSYLLYSTSLYMSERAPQDVTYLRENSIVSPRNLCGAAKLYTERELEYYAKVVNPSLRTVFARIYRVYGRDSKDVVSRWVNAALEGEAVEVYNAQNRFDYIFAGDVAEGLLRLAEAPQAEGVVNLGSGAGRSVRELLEILTRHFPDFSTRIYDRGQTEPLEASAADTERLRALTGWVPPTQLESGVRILCEYYASKAAHA